MGIFHRIFSEYYVFFLVVSDNNVFLLIVNIQLCIVN